MRPERTISDLCSEMGIDLHIMKGVNVNGTEEHSVYKFLKQGGPKIQGNFQTKFVVVCEEKQCVVFRHEGVLFRSLRDSIDKIVRQHGSLTTLKGSAQS